MRIISNSAKIDSHSAYNLRDKCRSQIACKWT